MQLQMLQVIKQSKQEALGRAADQVRKRTEVSLRESTGLICGTPAKKVQDIHGISGIKSSSCACEHEMYFWGNSWANDCQQIQGPEFDGPGSPFQSYVCSQANV